MEFLKFRILEDLSLINCYLLNVKMTIYTLHLIEN